MPTRHLSASPYDFPTGVVPKTNTSFITNQESQVQVKQHSHYFKDVSNLQTIDVYRVLELFSVTDPCIQHAVKKLLVAGGRGSKDISKDIQESIDSLKRYQEMRIEDGNS